MSLILGFPLDGKIVLAANTSTRRELVRTENPASARVFAAPVDAMIWIENLDGEITDRMRNATLYLYASHNLAIGPMGQIALRKIAERKNKTWLVEAVYRAIPVPRAEAS